MGTIRTTWKIMRSYRKQAFKMWKWPKIYGKMMQTTYPSFIFEVMLNYSVWKWKKWYLKTSVPKHKAIIWRKSLFDSFANYGGGDFGGLEDSFYKILITWCRSRVKNVHGRTKFFIHMITGVKLYIIKFLGFYTLCRYLEIARKIHYGRKIMSL